MKLTELIANSAFWLVWVGGTWFAHQHGFFILLAIPIMFIAATLVAFSLAFLLNKMN